MRKTPRGWIQIGESRTRGVARIRLGLKPSRDSRATSQRDSPIWIQPLGVFRYRRRRQRCIKVILGHCSTGLLEWYPVARRRRVMVRSHRRRPMRRISWEFNLGLGTEIYKYESFSATIGLPVCRAGFKILPMAPCVTPVIRSISTTCQRLSWESLTLSCNILAEIWRGIVWILQNLDQKVASTDGIRVKMIPFAHSVDLPRWFLMNAHSKLHEMNRKGDSLSKSIETTSTNWSHMFRDQLQAT